MSTRTAYEVGRDGAVGVFHRSGSTAWTHPNGQDCEVSGCHAIDAEKARAMLYGETSKPGRPLRTIEQDLERARKDRERKRARRLSP